ncbi:hypothetical protein CCB80_07440 [Armatimonadetes bacterium Uphvl-Ar1]|nr:hypothetical protein CCB80_07440 [Armatimonadetes bacterium Uphvl-Ar1]
MKVLNILGIAVAVLAFIALIAAQVIREDYAKRAVVYQRIEQTEEAKLFGDVGTKIGSPQAFIIDDPKAILPDTLEDGTRLLNENYLKAKSIYPLQLKTINETVSMVSLGTALALIAGIATTLFTRRKLEKTNA